jgi:hypothetical protein
MGLRDITTDLKERLAMVEEQGKAENAKYERDRKALDDQHNAKLGELQTEWEGLNRLLAAEQRRLGHNIDSVRRTVPAMSLDDFFVHVVEKFGIATKKNLREEAFNAGYFPIGETGGRQTHATLMNIVRSGRLREVGEDTYAPGIKHGEFLLSAGGADL